MSIHAYVHWWEVNLLPYFTISFEENFICFGWLFFTVIIEAAAE